MLNYQNEQKRLKIKAVKEKHSKNLINKHGLTGIGVGFKSVNGQITDKLCLVFMVEKKLSLEEIPKDQLLPKNLDGVECDVIEKERFNALSYTTKIRPAVPGYSVGHPLVTAGTLGCIVYKGSATYILSNNHVMANENSANVGDSIYQPGVYDGGTSSDTIAYLDSWITLTDGINVDCAIAKVNDTSLVTKTGVWGYSVDSYSTPSLGDTVYKSGRTTGDTSGVITFIHTDVAVNYGSLGVLTITDCFVANNSMSAGGDSGSVCRSNNTNAVGLLFAGNTTDTIFNYMSNVVAALGFSFTPPANKYWVGGTDNWDNTAGIKWSTSSGGVGGAPVPTSSDFVIIDSGTVTITASANAGSLTHTGGTLNTNGQTLTVVNSLTSSGTNSRNLNLGSSTLNCGGFTYSGSGLTLDSGTSIIKINGSGNFDGNGQTYYEVQLNGNFHLVTGANTFTSLKRTNTASLTDVLTFGANQTVSGTFTVTSNSVTNRILINSSLVGTQRTITAATFSINYASFKDIICAGAGSPAVPTSAQDLGNNSGITFPTSTRYWVGGTGNWSDGTNHWSLTSNGSPNQTPPGIIDNVFFDSNSSGSSYTITTDTSIYSNNLTFAQPLTGSVTWAGSTALSVYGDFTLVTGMTRSFIGAITFKSTGSQNITLASNTLNSNVTFDGVGGSWTLNDTFNIGLQLTITNGVVNTNNVTVTCSYLYVVNSSNVRGLTFGTSTVNITGTIGFNVQGLTNLTFSAASSTIILTGRALGSGVDLLSSGLTFGNVFFTNILSGYIGGVNTFSTLTVTQDTDPNYIKYNEFFFADNQTIGTFTFSGYSSTERSLINGPYQTPKVRLTATSVFLSNVDFRDIQVGGIANWDLSSIPGGSGDCGGNSGITFTSPVDQHWTNTNGGYWDNISNWTSRVPLPQDNVYFDCAFGTSKTVTANMRRLGKNIDWTFATWTTSLNFVISSLSHVVGYIYLFGSLKLVSGLTIATGGYGVDNINFGGRGSYTLQSFGSNFSMGMSVYAPGGTVTLIDDLTLGSTNTLEIAGGTLTTINGGTNSVITTGGIYNYGGTLTLGSATHLITGTSTWGGSVFIVSGSGNINANTSTLKFTNTSNTNITFVGGGKTYNNVYFSRGASTGSITLTGANTFSDFRDDGSISHSLLFPSSTSTTVSTFNVSGSAGNLITINSASGSTSQHTLIKSGGGTITNCDYLNINNSNATPSTTWHSGNNSINSGNNTGWIFDTLVTSTISVFDTNNVLDLTDLSSPLFAFDIFIPDNLLVTENIGIQNFSFVSVVETLGIIESVNLNTLKINISDILTCSEGLFTSSLSIILLLVNSSVTNSYSETNESATTTLCNNGGLTKAGQTFVIPKTGKIASVKFYLKKVNSPTGTGNAQLYTITGVSGVNGVPTGTALATSDNIDISTISTSLSLVPFTFSGANQYLMTEGVSYAIGFYINGGNFATNDYIAIGLDNTSPTDPGNCYLNTAAYSSVDTIFYVYTYGSGEVLQLTENVVANNIDILNINIFETIVLSEGRGISTPYTDFSPSIIDSLSITENETLNLVQDFFISVFDTLTCLENVEEINQLTVSVNETISIIENILLLNQISISVFDTSSITENLNELGKILSLISFENLTITENVIELEGIEILTIDSLIISENIITNEINSVLFITIFDNIVLSESLGTLKISNVSTFDSLACLESINTSGRLAIFKFDINSILDSNIIVIDSYSIINYDYHALYQYYNFQTAFSGQTFTNKDSIILDSAQFLLVRFGDPSGEIVVKIYSHSGTYGSNGIPIGAPLAISDPINVSNILTKNQIVTFNFSGSNRVILNTLTPYVVVSDGSGFGDSSNYILLSLDISSPTASGNLVYSSNGTVWNSYKGYAAIFYVYGEMFTENPNLIISDLSINVNDDLSIYENLNGFSSVLVINVMDSIIINDLLSNHLVVFFNINTIDTLLLFEFIQSESFRFSPTPTINTFIGKVNWSS